MYLQYVICDGLNLPSSKLGSKANISRIALDIAGSKYAHTLPTESF
jgi:hypothetical protein